MMLYHAEDGILFLSGPVMIEHVDDLVAVLQQSLAEPTRTAVQIDLSGVTDLDTASLQVLLSAYRSARQTDRKFQLLSVNAAVRARFRLTGLDFLCG